MKHKKYITKDALTAKIYWDNNKLVVYEEGETYYCSSMSFNDLLELYNHIFKVTSGDSNE